MFLLPECASPGKFAYPDYRFYYQCDLDIESPSALERKLYQCPVGKFFNSIYGACTKPSAFSGKQVWQLGTRIVLNQFDLIYQTMNNFI